MHVLTACFSVVAFALIVANAAIISTVPVTVSGRHDATHYFQNLTYAPTGEMTGLDKVVFALTMEPLSYNQVDQTTSVRTTIDAEIAISDSYPAHLRVSITRGYCRYTQPRLTLVDVPIVTPGNTSITETSTDNLLCNQIYYATVALVKNATTSVSLTEVLNILHVSEENIPCVPFQLRCPTFADYIYPPDAIPAELNVTRQSFLDPTPPLSLPYTNFASVGTWAEDILEGNIITFAERKITQEIVNKTLLSRGITLKWTIAPVPPSTPTTVVGTTSYNACYRGTESLIPLSIAQGGLGTAIVDGENTCDQEVYLDFRFFNGTFISQSRQNSLIVVENFGQLHQTIAGFDGQVCVRFQLDCTPFTPTNAISVIQNHEVLVGDISFTATNLYWSERAFAGRTPLYNSAANPSRFFNPFENNNLMQYNISTSIKRVPIANQTLGSGAAFAINVGFDYNTTQPFSPANASVVVRAFRNFCGVDESSPSFIGTFESGLLARGVAYSNEEIEGVFEMDETMCGQNMHLQIRIEPRGTVPDDWLIALTYGKYTVHGNKVDRSLCIQYYVDCDSPIVQPGVAPVAPGYTGYTYMNVIGIAIIGWSSLLILIIIIDIFYGIVFGPFGSD